MNEQMPCLYIITVAYHHPRRDPPSPIAHHPVLCYHTAISTRGEYSPELSISILSVCSIIEKRPRDSRSLRDLSIQHSLSSPRKPNYDLFGYYILLLPAPRRAPAERQMQIRSSSVYSTRESDQWSSWRSACISLSVCVITHYSSDAGAAFSRKNLV